MQILFKYSGKVIGGKKRGRNLGFPTINVKIHKKIPEGVYASEIKINKEVYFGATFIGGSKTYGESDYKSESFIFDFNKDVYGKWVSIKLINKIRDNIKFTSEGELISQIKKDILDIKKILK